MSDLISSNLSDDDKNSWRTDPRVFNALNDEFNFDLDAASSDKNYLVHKDEGVHLTKEDDALTCDWSKLELYYNGSGVFCKSAWINPPYGKGMIRKFMDKCIEQKERGVTSVLLVPATLETKWVPISEISEIRIFTGGRLSFYHPITNKKINGNTKGSMLVIFRPSKNPLSIRLIDRDELLRA